jgi:hypothetical protein
VALWSPICGLYLLDGDRKGALVSELEERLLALDATLEEAQKVGKAVVSAINRTRAAVKVGRVGEIAKGLSAISQRIAESNASAGGLADAWTFDVTAYLANGGFLNELKTAAAERERSFTVRE